MWRGEGQRRGCIPALLQPCVGSLTRTHVDLRGIQGGFNSKRRGGRRTTMRRVLSQSRAWVRSGASCMEQRTARALTATPSLQNQQPSRGVAIWSSRRREGGCRAMHPLTPCCRRPWQRVRKHAYVMRLWLVRLARLAPWLFLAASLIPAAYPHPLLTIQYMRAHCRRHGSYTHPDGSGPRCQRHAEGLGKSCVACPDLLCAGCACFRLCSGEWRDPPAMVRRAAEAEHVHPGTVLGGWGAGTVCTRIADSSL